MQRDGHSELARIDAHYRTALMSFFVRRVRNQAEAEDLTQEVFLRLAKRDGPVLDTPAAYIFQIAANLLRDRSRRTRVRSAYTATEALDEPNIDLLDPFRFVSARVELENLSDSLRELPERTRAIFILYRIENVEKITIARSLGISKSAVTQHVVKAMAHLMAQLRENR